jgi:hypothetical protein
LRVSRGSAEPRVASSARLRRNRSHRRGP